MDDARAAKAFEEAGWATRDEDTTIGEYGRYAIRPDTRVIGDETVFELRDRELGMKVFARRVPPPERAAALLERYGAPEEISDLAPGKVPMAPPGAELE
jgi:hypothetical protein